MTTIFGEAGLVNLPTELIQSILCLLDPFDLVACAKTCRELAAISYDDIIWAPIVNECAGERVTTPAPLQSFRSLYISFFPYWFLTQNRIWFGDTEPNGKLVLARYDSTSGCISAHQLVAVTARKNTDFSFWEKDREVIIQKFNPQVTLDKNQAVLKLDANMTVDDGSTQIVQYDREAAMEIATNSGLHSSFMLCRALPEDAIRDGAAVWPSSIFPASSRARNTSQDGFRSVGHRPKCRVEMSSNNFRIRKWAEYGQSSSPFPGPGSRISAALGINLPYFTNNRSSRASVNGSRIPETITSYSSLPPESYMPSAEKPWQGIWCGDYNSHGCEFLLLTQPDGKDARPLPEGMDLLSEWFSGSRTESDTISTLEEQTDEAVEERAIIEAGINAAFSSHEWDTRPLNTSPNLDEVPSGRLEGIKLTGDPNVPRGQFSFIVPDIGRDGLIRVADEQPFTGSRVVRSAGHIAQRGFQEDCYTPSQLILISHDRIAQYWMGFHHISFYQRVDLPSLMKLDFDKTS